MGGNAFHLDGCNFPRFSCEVYATLKERYTSILQTLFKHVKTPKEAPEKTDHGDVDFLVCDPLCDDAILKVQAGLGAQYANIVRNHTSNFAIRQENALANSDDSTGGNFYQVDVHECSDLSELERVAFFHSYGDLGMILGMMAHPYGFSLGTKGLKTHYAKSDDTHISSFCLSFSIAEIMTFSGLDMDRYKRGFRTNDELFAWLRTSRWFQPLFLAKAHPAMDKRAAKCQRSMYSDFIKQFEVQSGEVGESGANIENMKPDVDSWREEALLFFGKKEEYDQVAQNNILERAYREKFTGKKVMERTGLYGLVIRDIMEHIRKQYSKKDISQMDEDCLRNLVLKTQKLVCVTRGESEQAQE